MESEDKKEYIEKCNEYREIIKFFEECLSDDPVRMTSYIKEFSKIRTNPVIMTEKIGIAFGEIYRKNQTAKASTKSLLNLIDDKDAEKILHFCERYPRNWIERSGEYLVLGEKFRELCKVPDDYKTTSERAQEIISGKTAVSKDECADIIKKMEEIEKNREKPEEKSKIKKFFHSFYEPVRISVNLPSIRPYYDSYSRKIKSLPKEALKATKGGYKSLEEVTQPFFDFINQRPTWLKRYHLALAILALPAMYWLGSTNAVKKTINTAYNTSSEFVEFVYTSDIEKGVLSTKKIAEEKEYNALEKRIERKSIKEKKEIEIKEDIINERIELKKAAEKNKKNAERSRKIDGIKKYVVCAATTTYNGWGEMIKNSDLALYFAKKGKDSAVKAAKEGKSLVNGYIDEKASDKLKEMERKDKKK